MFRLEVTQYSPNMREAKLSYLNLSILLRQCPPDAAREVPEKARKFFSLEALRNDNMLGQTEFKPVSLCLLCRHLLQVQFPGCEGCSTIAHAYNCVSDEVLLCLLVLYTRDSHLPPNVHVFADRGIRACAWRK